MDQIGTYEECDTFLEFYALAQKGDRTQVDQLIEADGVDVDIRFTVRSLPPCLCARLCVCLHASTYSGR